MVRPSRIIRLIIVITGRVHSNQLGRSPAESHSTVAEENLDNFIGPRHNRRHGASHKGQQINQWSEDDMCGALQEWQEDKTKALRMIARSWNVPYATFRRRVVGHANHVNAAHASGRPTVLLKEAEHELADVIRKLAAAGFPCDRRDVKSLAYEYAVKNGIHGFSANKKCAGHYWFQNFLRRHPDLTMKKAENLSVPRAMSMNLQQVTTWFEKYDEIVSRLGIKDLPSYLWNVDETGCQNIHKADAVVGVVGKPSYNITALEKGETSSVMTAQSSQIQSTLLTHSFILAAL